MLPVPMNWIMIGAMAFVSYQAFGNRSIYEKFVFHPFSIAHGKEWYRLFSCTLLHADFNHLLINMIVLWSFGDVVEPVFEMRFGIVGSVVYLLFFILAVGISNLSTYLKHRHNASYFAVGASGGVSAVVFSAIFFAPDSKLLLFFILPIPAGIFGIVYLIYSSWAQKNAPGGINHDAHFWGGVFGFLATLALFPTYLPEFVKRLLGIFGL